MSTTIEIVDEFIKLGDLLKFSGYTITGGEAKIMITRGGVKVNGEIVTERGRKIKRGDVVVMDIGEIVVV